MKLQNVQEVSVIKRVVVLLDNGEEIKISDPIYAYEDDENGIFSVSYPCTYYDQSGEHKITKSYTFNMDHIIYIRSELREENNEESC